MTRLRTSTTRQRQQWRKRSAEKRERARHPLFPGSKRLDPIKQYSIWLSDMEAQNLVAGLTARHGIDDEYLEDRDFHRLVEFLIEYIVKNQAKKITRHA